jgi:tetratricopeptide (TPR) repeat protein
MKNTLINFLISFLLVCCSKSAESFFEEGEEKFELHKYEAAISSYSEAIRINPKFADAYRRRGHSKSRIGKHKEAIIDFELALKNNPNDYRPLFRKAFSLYILNQHDKAIFEINKLLSINPKYSKAYVLRAAVYYGNYSAPIQMYQ